MATLEVAQTLLGLSRAADCKWDSDDDDDEHEPAEVPSEQSDQADFVLPSPQHDDDRMDKNVSTKKRPRKNESKRKTKRTLNAVRNFYFKAEELKVFKREHGHCNVPQTYPENQPLANW